MPLNTVAEKSHRFASASRQLAGHTPVTAIRFGIRNNAKTRVNRQCRSSFFPDRRDQPAAGTGKARHYGAYRHFRRLSDLAVVKALDVPQHQRLPEWRGQCSDCRAELFGVNLRDERCLWSFAVRLAWLGVLKLDRLEIFYCDDRSWAILTEP